MNLKRAAKYIDAEAIKASDSAVTAVEHAMNARIRHAWAAKLEGIRMKVLVKADTGAKKASRASSKKAKNVTIGTKDPVVTEDPVTSKDPVVSDDPSAPVRKKILDVGDWTEKRKNRAIGTNVAMAQDVTASQDVQTAAPTKQAALDAAFIIGYSQKV